MLILAYMPKTSLEWRTSERSTKIVVPRAETTSGAAANLSEIVSASRTGAKTEVRVADGRLFSDILRISSRDADLIFTGKAEPSEIFSSYYESLQECSRGLPTTVFVLVGESLRRDQVMRESVFTIRD